MTWQDAAHTAGNTGSSLFDGGFSWGTLLLVIGMFASLAVVSSLGILARIRDRAADRTAVVNRQRPAADQLPGGGPPLTG
jgi:hypothetical protein